MPNNTKRSWWHRVLVWFGLRKADPVLVSDIVDLPGMVRFTPLNADGTKSRWAAPTELFYQEFDLNTAEPVDFETKQCYNVPCPDPESVGPLDALLDRHPMIPPLHREILNKIASGEIQLPTTANTETVWPSWPEKEEDDGFEKPE